ncbi:MAG: thrombospondin type 3 repeat-containing protein [Deltaproteobacteria bacterium]|nr:thrombospondin type 3 repeat-containing protein [Deltaproteobacteria bacterium]
MQPFLTQYYSGDNIEFQGSISVVNYPGHGWCIAGHNNILERMLAIHNELDGFKISGNFAFLKGIQSLLNSSNGISLSGNGATIQPSVINSNSGTNKIQLPVFAANSQKGIYIESSQNNIFSTQSFSNKEAGVYISGNQSKINLKELIAYDNKAGAGGMGILFAGYINDDIKAPTVVELTNDGQDNLSGSVDVHLIQPDTSYELHVYIAESKDMTDGQPTQARYLVKTVILVPNMQKSDGVYSVNILADEIKKALGKSVISQETYFTFMLTDPSKGSSVYSLAYKKPEKPTILLVITPAWLELLKVLANPDFLKAMDEDGDGTITTLDNCPSVANADQLDTDGDKAGDACDADDDNDGVNDGEDNCPLVGNPFQEDADGDGAGAVCDPDDGNVLVDDDQDDDGVKDAVDNCPNVANADQADVDHDSEGDLCDSDDTIKDNDSDGVEDAKDNCPSLANPDQTDSDSDGTGDVCEPVVTPTPTPTSVATPTPTSTPTPTTKPTPTPVTSCPDGQVLQGGQCVTPVINLPLEENSSGGCSLQPNFEAGASPWVFKGLIALWVGLLYLMRRDLKAKNLRKI